MAIPLILALAGMATQQAGKEQAASSTVGGAKTQADISRLGLNAQELLLAQQLGLTEADRAAGYSALPGLTDYVYNRKAPVGGLSQFRGELMQNALSKLRPEVRDSITKRAAAGEEEAGYGRLLDLARIGQGESASAGQAYGGYSNALSNVLMQGAQNRGGALQQAANTRQGIASDTAGTLGQIPAYMKQRQYSQGVRQDNLESDAGDWMNQNQYSSF